MFIYIYIIFYISFSKVFKLCTSTSLSLEKEISFCKYPVVLLCHIHYVLYVHVKHSQNVK